MKKLLASFLVSMGLFTAQNSTAQGPAMVAVPDANFRAKLVALGYSGCFNATMDSINSNCSMVQTTYNLNLSNANISNLSGIEAFHHINALTVANNNLSTIPAFNNGTLDLWSLDASHNNITSVGALSDSLGVLHLDYNPLSTLPSLPLHLVTLTLDHTNVSALPATLPSPLQALSIISTPITTLPMLPIHMGILKIDSTAISLIPNMPNYMNHLSCRSTSINMVPTLPGTTTYLDVYNANVTCLPLMTVGNNTQQNPTTVLCDTSIIHCRPMPNYNVAHGGNNIFISSFPYCGTGIYTQCPAGFNITGTVFYDSTSNCAYDNTDAAIPGAKVSLLDMSGTVLSYTFTNTIGQYILSTPGNGNYKVVVDTAALAIGTSCTAYQYLLSTITTADPVDANMNFGLHCNGTVNDKATYGVSATGIHFPGDIFTVKALVSSQGLCAPSTGGTVKIIKTGSAQILSAAAGALAPTFINNDSVIWNVSDFNTINLSTAFKVTVKVDTNATLGTLICYQTKVSTTLPETNYSNNQFNACYVVVNSYDPNDKNVQPRGNVSPDNQWLVYTIRFQNTGNATARNINIKDTLSTYLDINTLEVLDFSFKPVVDVTIPQRALRFGFNGINLPDSFSNEPMSHGYVTYRVKQLGNLPAGTEIRNTAHIYFDYNSPVVTNTAITTIEIPSGIKNVDKQSSLLVYPNPVDQLFTLTIEGKMVQNGQVMLYDITGKQVFAQSLKGSNPIHIGHLPGGNYVLHYINQKGETFSFKITKK